MPPMMVFPRKLSVPNFTFMWSSSKQRLFANPLLEDIAAQILAQPSSRNSHSNYNLRIRATRLSHNVGILSKCYGN